MQTQLRWYRGNSIHRMSMDKLNIRQVLRTLLDRTGGLPLGGQQHCTVVHLLCFSAGDSPAKVAVSACVVAFFAERRNGDFLAWFPTQVSQIVAHTTRRAVTKQSAVALLQFVPDPTVDEGSTLDDNRPVATKHEAFGVKLAHQFPWLGSASVAIGLALRRRFLSDPDAPSTAIRRKQISMVRCSPLFVTRRVLMQFELQQCVGGNTPVRTKSASTPWCS